MLNQREYKVSFVRAWIDFFKNILSFRGYTTRKGYWSVILPIALLSTIVLIYVAVNLYNFAFQIYENPEALRQLQLLSTTGLTKKSIVIEKLGLSGIALESYEKLYSSLIFTSIYTFIVSIITLTLSVRRFRDVGFAKGGLWVVYIIRFVFSIVPISQIVMLIFGLAYSVVFPCFKSKKFSSTKEDSKLKQFFFSEKEEFDDVEIE